MSSTVKFYGSEEKKITLKLQAVVLKLLAVPQVEPALTTDRHTLQISNLLKRTLVAMTAYC